MPTLHLHTSIRAPIARVFDLCRSVEAHTESAHRTSERAVAGTMHGLLALGDHVTWSARHLGWRWRLTSRITRFDRPHHFRDSMVDGPFARFDHDHTFAERDGTTLVHDVFDYTSPLGLLGRLADALLVERHLRRFLTARLQTIRELAESDAWRQFLPEEPAAAASSPPQAAPRRHT